MSTYLKNIAGYKHNQLKNKSFEDIQKIFEKSMKRVNQFVDIDTKLVEGNEKRAGASVMQERARSKRIDALEIDDIPFATKPPSIVDGKIHKEGQTSYYQITRADESSKMYLVFSQLLKSFDMEDLETLWRLVKAKHGNETHKEEWKQYCCARCMVFDWRFKGSGRFGVWILSFVPAAFGVMEKLAACYDPSCISTKDPYWIMTKMERRLQRYDLQLIMSGDMAGYKGNGKFIVSFREMITSQLQGKLWLYDEVRTQLCLFCHHQIGDDCWDS
ncbi:hypothetical protein Tco_1167318 [Tanacetum coccineum]